MLVVDVQRRIDDLLDEDLDEHGRAELWALLDSPLVHDEARGGRVWITSSTHVVHVGSFSPPRE